MRIGAVTWARNECSIPHAVLSYKSFAQNRKGETNAVRERDSAEKRPLEAAQFRSGGRESEISRGDRGSSGSNREFYLLEGLGKNNQPGEAQRLVDGQAARQNPSFSLRNPDASGRTEFATSISVWVYPTKPGAIHAAPGSAIRPAVRMSRTRPKAACC
jgi:hypothetical protein